MSAGTIYVRGQNVSCHGPLKNISVKFHNSVLLLSDLTDIIAGKKALKWGLQKRRERTRIRSEEMGEEGCLNPTLFGGRYLGMSVDQPQKKGILN